MRHPALSSSLTPVRLSGGRRARVRRGSFLASPIVVPLPGAVRSRNDPSGGVRRRGRPPCRWRNGTGRREWRRDPRCQARSLTRITNSGRRIRLRGKLDASAAGVLESIARHFGNGGGDAGLILRLETEEPANLAGPLPRGTTSCSTRISSRESGLLIRRFLLRGTTRAVASSRPRLASRYNTPAINWDPADEARIRLQLHAADRPSECRTNTAPRGEREGKLLNFPHRVPRAVMRYQTAANAPPLTRRPRCCRRRNSEGFLRVDLGDGDRRPRAARGPVHRLPAGQPGRSRTFSLERRTPCRCPRWRTARVPVRPPATTSALRPFSADRPGVAAHFFARLGNAHASHLETAFGWRLGPGHSAPQGRTPPGPRINVQRSRHRWIAPKPDPRRPAVEKPSRKHGPGSAFPVPCPEPALQIRPYLCSAAACRISCPSAAVFVQIGRALGDNKAPRRRNGVEAPWRPGPSRAPASPTWLDRPRTGDALAHHTPTSTSRL